MNASTAHPPQAPLTVRRIMPVVGVLLLLWLVFLLNLSQPYYGIRDSQVVWIPAAMRNYDWYGADALHYLLARDTYPQEGLDALTINTHHPPLVVWLPTVWTQIAGFNEAMVRYVFTVAAFVAASAFYALVRQYFGPTTALWSVAFFGLNPLIAYYNTTFNHDPLGFPWVMLFALVFTRWQRRGIRWHYVVLLLLAVLAAWTSWAAVFVVAGISAWGVLAGSRWRRIGAGGLLLLTGAAAAAVILFFESQLPGAIYELLDVFLWRTSSASTVAGSESFTALDWVVKQGVDVMAFAGVGLVGLAVIGAVWFRRDMPRRGWSVWAGWLLGALAYLLVFRNASFNHNFYKVWLMPPLALLAGVAAAKLLRRGYAPTRRWGYLRTAALTLVVAAAIQAVVIMGLFTQVFHQPDLDAAIRYLNAADVPSGPVLVRHEGWSVKNGFATVLSFYTARPVYANLPAADVPGDPLAVIITCATGEETPPAGDALNDHCTATIP